MSVFATVGPGVTYFVFVLAISAGLLVFSYLYWRKKMGPSAGTASAACGFSPHRISLRGTHGEILRAKARVDGPAALMFTTFVDEPWLLVVPSSGIMPQEVEIIAYTKHAPVQKRQTLTVRLLPVDGETSFSQMDVELHLKKSKPSLQHLPHP